VNLKKLLIVGFIFLQLILVPRGSKAGYGQYCSTPPFISAGAKPNVLIILDNSNSMDEDFYGEAVGSYSSNSKSVVAKKALRDFISALKDKLRIGLMTYSLNNDIGDYHLHNSLYFASYHPKSYCPSYSKVCSNNTSQTCENDEDCSGGSCVDPCVKYCQTGNSTYKAICKSQCQASNPSFDVGYFDEIITNYSIGSEQRNRYCRLVYPKTQRMVNPTDTSHYIYYKHAYPFYSDNDEGTGFAYAPSYDPDEGCQWVSGDFCATDQYEIYTTKIGTSDGFSGYSGYVGTWWLGPTDTDLALGYEDFGRRQMWYHVGMTWFSNTSPGDGYLHVEIDDLVNDDGSPTSTYEDLWNKLDPKENDEAGYMSCRLRDKNKCEYIVNAGLTPTAGTLQSAIDYFSGSDSPIQVRCQRNFVVYVTDGLPSVDENGNSHTADDLMPSVLEKIDALRQITKNINGTDYTFDIKTYVLGVGLSDEAKAKLDEMAVHGGTDREGHAYYADNPEELTAALNKIFTDILKQTSSGTSVSVLAERAKEGTNMLQAVFYPEKHFEDGDNDRKVNWIGYLYTWWLYNSSKATNIREDTIENKALDICGSDGTNGGDYILDFLLEEDSLEVNAYKSTLGGEPEGYPDDPVATYTSLDDTHPVWEAGEKLKDKTPGERKIYTTTGNLQPSSPVSLTELKNVSSSKLFGDENEDNEIDGDGETTKLISQPISFNDLKNFIYGEEIEGYRSRKVDNAHTWKLGDIVYSTPKIVAYEDYAVVYVGANDGMLHAFRLGKQRFDNLGPYQAVKLCDDTNVPCSVSRLGEELWAFIPKNTLPYLRALTDLDYCHLYYVDLTPYVIQLDTDRDGKVDKRILIGGMRLGGAVGCSGSDCINPPEDTCPNPSNYNPSTDNCIGLSSYFALDVTDPEQPKFLWEFTDKDLGFTYSGPAFIKRNGNYYIMFVSGPTNYRGESDQDLIIFVLKLKSDFTIDIVNKIGPTHPGLPTFNRAFGGRLFTNGIDYDNDGNTDAVFFGVTRAAGGSSNWRGNVVVVKITDDDPTKWEYEKIFNTSGPSGGITAKVAYSKCFNMHYIYFGTGRYFYKEDDPGQNPNDTEYLYGVRIDPCLEGNGSCNIDAAHNSRDICSELTRGGGPRVIAWKQELEAKQGDYFKERMITDPTVTDWDSVFLTTMEPTADICGYGGRSRVWGLNCATGESLSEQNCNPYVTDRTIAGTLFLQLSGGNIEQIHVDIQPNCNGTGSDNPFTAEDNKATEWMVGVPPEAATPLVQLASGSKKGQIIYWIEK